MIPPAVVDAFADMTVLGAVTLAVGLFGSSLVPFFLLVNVDFGAAWQAAQAAGARAWEPCRELGRDAAALLILLLTSPKGYLA